MSNQTIIYFNKASRCSGTQGLLGIWLWLVKNHVFVVILLKTRLENLSFVLQDEWQSNVLDRLYQIMIKIIVLSWNGADRYQKIIFDIHITFVPPFINKEFYSKMQQRTSLHSDLLSPDILIFSRLKIKTFWNILRYFIQKLSEKALQNIFNLFHFHSTECLFDNRNYMYLLNLDHYATKYILILLYEFYCAVWRMCQSPQI